MRKRPRILKNYIRKGGLRGEGLRGDYEGCPGEGEKSIGKG